MAFMFIVTICLGLLSIRANAVVIESKRSNSIMTASDHGQILLRDFPILMSHDSCTGYHDPSFIESMTSLDTPVAD